MRIVRFLGLIALDKVEQVCYYVITKVRVDKTTYQQLKNGGNIMTFGEKIKNLRIACKKTQAELADETGVAKRSIQLYEAGQRLPKMDKIYDSLAQYFNVPVEFLKVEHTDDFDKCAEYAYGTSGKKQAEDLANQIVGLFAGGQVSEEDADKVMLVLQKAYWDIKEKKAKENGLL